jgi:adenylate cyclase
MALTRHVAGEEQEARSSRRNGWLRLHLGIHAGDVIREEDPDGRANVYGGAVNIAARIAGASAPGEVLVSDTVRSLARTSAGVGFEDKGERSLKGVADPQRLFAVREGE